MVRTPFSLRNPRHTQAQAERSAYHVVQDPHTSRRTFGETRSVRQPESTASSPVQPTAGIPRCRGAPLAIAVALPTGRRAHRSPLDDRVVEPRRCATPSGRSSTRPRVGPTRGASRSPASSPPAQTASAPIETGAAPPRNGRRSFARRHPGWWRRARPCGRAASH